MVILTIERSTTMNKTMIAVIAFVMGGGAGFLVATKRLEEKYARYAEDEIESVRRAFDDMTEKEKSDEDISEESEQDLYASQIDHLGYAAVNSTTDAINRAKKNYNIISPSKNNNLGEFVEDDYDEVNPVPLKSERAPYVIQETDFSEDYLNFDKISLTYYIGDDCLVDEDDDVIADPNQMVGNDNLSLENATDEHPNTVFVRNERMMADFEISMEPGKFSIEVLSVENYEGMSPREQQEKRMRDKRRSEEND